ncbi:MAG: O-antigen ligase family protein [Syntrophaceae bacterium]|nr:O-antigen ligase family protein [Syntrophaceae bacterium]
MESYLALFVCLIFCSFIYWKDSKEDPEISLAIWIPILWMMRCASRSLTYWLYPAGYYADIEGSIHDRIFFIILITAGLIILSRRRVKWNEILTDNSWLFIFFAYMALSAFWSDNIWISLKRWIRAFGDLMMVLIVLTETNQLQAIAKLYRKCFILLLPLSVVLIKYFPHIGRFPSKNWAPDMWIGVATHKNTLGQLALLAAMYFLWSFLNNRDKGRRVIDLVYLMITAYLLNGGGGSRSTTCIVIIFLLVAFYAIVERMKIEPGKIWVLLTTIVVVFFTFNFLSDVLLKSSVYNIFIESLGKDGTLAGRTDLWKDLMQLGMLHPILGAGFGGFWTPEMAAYLKEIHSWGPGQAHSGYIEIFINLGVVGIVLFILIVFSSLRRTIKQMTVNHDFGLVRLILLLATLLHNYSESGFTRPTHLMWFTFILAVVSVSNGSPSKTLLFRRSKNE